MPHASGGSAGPREPLGGTAAPRVPKAAEIVAADLRRQIVGGAIGLDERLPAEADLMRIYHVSRPTLREALRILESESLIVVRRGAHGGARAVPPDPSVATRAAGHLLQLRGTTLTDVFAARRVIEAAAVRLLAEHPTAAAIELLRSAHDHECSLRTDRDRYSAAAATFHARVVEAGGNKTLVVVHELTTSIVRRHHVAVFRGNEDQFDSLVDTAVGEHAELLALVGSGDADGAEALWRRHVDRVAVMALRRLGPDRVIDLFGARD